MKAPDWKEEESAKNPEAILSQRRGCYLMLALGEHKGDMIIGFYDVQKYGNIFIDVVFMT